MTMELTALAVATVLGFAHVIGAWHAVSLQRGYRWPASTRDEPTPTATEIVRRLERARKDYIECFAFFTAAILVVHAEGAESPGTAWAAWTYVIAPPHT
jgi:uncharacterized MAPEG superfamily protein